MLRLDAKIRQRDSSATYFHSPETSQGLQGARSQPTQWLEPFQHHGNTRGWAFPRQVEEDSEASTPSH